MIKLRHLYIKWLVWRGKALDIWSSNGYPSQVLSNLCSNRFIFEGVFCHSMEGFLQSLKYNDPNRQRQICAMKGRRAKMKTTTTWQTDQIVWWKGSAINRQSKEFQDLIRRAYRAMFEQNERFRIALMSTRGMKLYHSRGEHNPYKTILTESEYCTVLTEIRDTYNISKNEASMRKKRLYFDMDGVLTDFESALAEQDEQTLKEYVGRYDEIPGLFGQMLPMDGAIDAVRRLSEHYDCYILSTAPWKNPSAWSDKVMWVTRYLDDVFHKRMVITHCKNLCKGDILIDDRGKNGTSEFEGEWIQFGSERFPNWESVLDYLLPVK
ncbi:MAG: hypothetical protein IKV23_00175 [Bacteroidaceae bacterium]|nr:hypothetical protein [Bacteroidaceae bacterium]